MSNTRKPTQRDNFNEIREILVNGGYPDHLIEFIDSRLAQLDKKSNAPKKLTPQQEKNEITKRGILANMEVGERYTISDMLIGFDCFDAETSPQRVSALLSQLGARGTGEIVRTEEKGKAYFSLA